MATAKRHRTTVMVPKEIDDGVTLELSRGEACALGAVMAHVGGIPELSARGLITQIDKALASVGIDTEDPDDWIEGTAGIHFKNGTRVLAEKQ